MLRTASILLTVHLEGVCPFDEVAQQFPILERTPNQVHDRCVFVQSLSSYCKNYYIKHLETTFAVHFTIF